MPKYYKTSEVMDNINNANAIELDNLNNRLDSVLNQFFVDSADFTLNRWEKELGLKVRNSYSTEFRRNRIKAKLRGAGTFTKNAVIGLGNTFDLEKGTEFIPYIGEYRFSTRNKAIDIIDFEGLMEAFTEMKPAHLRFDPILYTVVPGQKFKRYTSLNYLSSIMRTGESKSKRSINSKREIDLLYLSTQQIALDGARKLDSVWVLNGSEVEQPIKYNLGLKLSVPVTKSIVNSYLSEIKSIRTVNIYSGSSVLNGAWLLDADQNLSGLRSMSVKINGIAV